MDRVDWVGLQCLRRSSRVFMRLFGAYEFRSQCVKPLPPQLRNIPWPNAIPKPSNHPEAEQLVSLLLRDRYCSQCRHVRQLGLKYEKYRALMAEQVYCAGCKQNHPRALFSASQRLGYAGELASSSSNRVCIAHEGYIRVCRHVVIRWSNIRSWADQYDFEDKGIYESVVLPPTPICSAHYQTFPCKLLRQTPSKVSLSITKTPKNLLHLYLSWNHHLPTQPIRLGAYTANDLRRDLEETYQDTSQFLISDLKAGRSAIMGYVDPNYCSCIRYAGSDKLDWQLSPIRQGAKSCRSDVSLSLGSSAPSSFTHTTSISSYRGSGRAKHTFIEFHGLISPCYCGGLQVQYRRTFVVGFDVTNPNRPTADYYEALDPESYNLGPGDEESRHILWCADRSCENYYWHRSGKRYRYVFKNNASNGLHDHRSN
ncbi:hypothetical protein B0T24DRAFT_626979 [Lasiosphaeria ovina]|uniref:Uncharacterized protein n=1 Tax=Lasiosphaeria ovina TaxID=92902 RepID=A0AAE0N619_9PEZI|nr:hypothetical protein B0T24DRAFT_626979 [Lasiosphaeria ovina]